MIHLLDDPWLAPFRDAIENRAARVNERERELAAGPGSLAEFANAHEFYGLHLRNNGWVFREWAPNATAMWMVGDFSNWQIQPRFQLTRVANGAWEIHLPADALHHGQHYHLEVHWDGGRGERIPAYARRVVQDPATKLFSAQVWHPEKLYEWKHSCGSRGRSPSMRAPLIYECHIGMAQEEPRVGTYGEFREKILPRIAEAGYNTLQIMAVMEHPYYGSFGYQVSSFFAASSRFGTPEEFKRLVDDAHGLGLAVIMDLVHSHAVKNERDGLSLFDGTDHQYFHHGSRGWHDAWDSRCFDYGKTDVLHFLLSNCRFWLDEYHLDGFRFDGVTSMLYLHNGIGADFTRYEQYFDETVDAAAWVYLGLANRVIHAVRPGAITIAEDVSGMPGLAAPAADGGAGFDYRMAMGVPDCWFKLVRDTRDEDWSIGYLWHELTNHRDDECTINYVESHDQAMVGGKTLLFEMMDAAVYDAMHRGAQNPATGRAVALHKMARLATLAACGHGYLNFMGNEFGHPEWIDFPREGNGFSHDKARRRWSLRDDPGLLFSALADFDRAMLQLFTGVQKFGSPGVQNGGTAPLKKIPVETSLLDIGHFSPLRLYLDEPRKILAFQRGPYVFIFNFHSTESVADHPIPVPPGAYRGVLNTDSPRFGGQGRVEENQPYPVVQQTLANECVFHVNVYLPCRVALVLAREP
ncbi:MAG: alpha amylase C-terminal domain-containing protein [Kiritimatiellaeota bacterium]|nr:alpha amylase C-terminal domain-containing protein [Kiritimatiellota bacterium]